MTELRVRNTVGRILHMGICDSERNVDPCEAGGGGKKGSALVVVYLFPLSPACKSSKSQGGCKCAGNSATACSSHIPRL